MTKLADLLTRCANGRREYANNAPADMQHILNAEAETLDAVARVLSGDHTPLYAWLPSWRWTPDMLAALNHHEPNPHLPPGTTTATEYTVRWTWPDGTTDGTDCTGIPGRVTPHQHAINMARAFTHRGVTGEVLRRQVHTTPDEVIETYPANANHPRQDRQ